MAKLLDLALAGYQLEKQASLADVAKTFASTAKGVGSVAKNLVKQNPTAAKAALGGAVAGAAVTKMTSGQTKQAAKKNEDHTVGRRLSLTAGSITGAVGGLVGASKLLDTHEQAVHDGAKGVGVKKHLNSNVYGIARKTETLGHKAFRKATVLGKPSVKAMGPLAGWVGGAFAGSALANAAYNSLHKKAEEKNPYGAVRHIRDAAFTAIDGYAGKALGGVTAAVTSKHHPASFGHAQRMGFGKGVGLAAGVAVGVANSIGRREEHQKHASTTGDKGLDKEEKDNGEPTGVTSTSKPKSSLIAAARAEMAKVASKKQ